MSANVFLKKLRLRNFRSVRDTEIMFDNPLFLVGRNGSGKSNVVDAIAFLADCVNSSLSAAMKERNFLSRAVYTGTDYESPYVELKVDFSIVNVAENKEEGNGFYHLRLKIIRTKMENNTGYSVEYNSDYLVDIEECFIEHGEGRHFFKRRDNTFETNVAGIKPRLVSHNLALSVIGGVKEFAFVADSFAAMRVYRIDHRKIREEEGVPSSPILDGSGKNIAGVLTYLYQLEDESSLYGVDATVRTVAPGQVRFFPGHYSDGTSTITGLQHVDYSSGPFRQSTVSYSRDAFSDGTLHVLGLAVALNQNPMPSVIVIEEPENNLHPGALNAIADLIEEASRKTQVIITTHSPDLLDVKWIKPENLRVVVWEDDASRVAELAERPKAALREHLMYAGQLMRANALEPAPVEEGVTEAIAETPSPVTP